MTAILRILLLFIFISLRLSGQFSGDSLPKRKIDTFSKVHKDTLQGQPLINFSTELLDGEKITLSEYKGKVILLNFWFIGCVPCMGEIPDINQVYKTFKDSGVTLLSLALNTRDKVHKFNAGKYSRLPEKIEYPIIPDCQKIADNYKVTGYPTTILIDKKGVIRLVISGATIQSLKKYIALFGDKGLSKEWKSIANQSSGASHTQLSDILSELLRDLLKE